jgi:hypothetical protein
MPTFNVATKAFEHGNLAVKVGDVYSSADLVVQQCGHCFVSED